MRRILMVRIFWTGGNNFYIRFYWVRTPACNIKLFFSWKILPSFPSNWIRPAASLLPPYPTKWVRSWKIWNNSELSTGSSTRIGRCCRFGQNESRFVCWQYWWGGETIWCGAGMVAGKRWCQPLSEIIWYAVWTRGMGHVACSYRWEMTNVKWIDSLPLM